MASGTRTDGQEEALRWNSDAGPLIEGLFAFMRKYTSARLRCHIWFDVDRQDTLDILHHCLREKPNAITFHRQAAEHNPTVSRDTVSSASLALLINASRMKCP